jgi:hypothetical protein
MATVNFVPLSNFWRGKSLKFSPMPPPIYQDGPATKDDIALARELFQALDPESQEWYRFHGYGRRS